MEQLKIHYVKLGDLVPNPRNSRTHSDKQIKKLASLIKEFGFNDPVHISDGNVLICGHARLEAAKLVGLEALPTIHLGHLDEMQQRAYLIAHNRVAIEAGWDNAVLSADLAELRSMGFDLELTAFDNDELIKLAPINDKDMGLSDKNDSTITGSNPISRPGDIWLLGANKLICGEEEQSDCDIIIKKWQHLTGKKAIHEASKLTFDEIADG